ncbi:stage III sporulation protein AD [Brevibacillus sp. GCM10020057]|uniref:stage III sporulation protein AD n=1 Tax=Brevibacillus sp. GCM10020057 TaxID=3317327 RepID=UPI003640D96D
MDIVQVVVLGLIATILVLLIKEQKPIFAVLLALISAIFIFFLVVDKIVDVIRILERLAVQADLNLVFLETILKIIGIAYIAEFGAQLTRDAGQGAIASKIELAGKVLILVMAVPIIQIIIETVIDLLPA